MGEITEPHKSFVLKFRHINARVTVMQKGDSYLAFIVFPMAYKINPPHVHHALPEMMADSLDAACEMAYTQFKIFYAPLDRQIRLIGRFNFFVHRISFRTIVESNVGDVKWRFVVTRQMYAISENVDGEKYFKTTFDTRENTATYRALYLINVEQVFGPMQALGFNGKFIKRLLYKHDKVKVNRLRLFNDHKLIDDLTYEKLDNHVSNDYQAFYNSLNWEKAKRMMKL